MLGTILMALLIAVLAILTLPLMLIFYIVSLFDGAAAHRGVQFFGAALMRFILFVSGTKVVVENEESIPGPDEAGKDIPVLFVSNHRSYFDILAELGYAKKPVAFIAKKEIGRVPILKQWMILLHCYFLDRRDPKDGFKMVLYSIDLLKKGCSIWIYPEGTRSKTESETEPIMFHNGSFKIAEKPDVPVVPVAVYGTRKLYEGNGKRFRPGTVVIRYGQPVRISELSEEDQKNVGDHFHDIVREMLIDIDREYAGLK